MFCVVNNDNFLHIGLKVHWSIIRTLFSLARVVLSFEDLVEWSKLLGSDRPRIVPASNVGLVLLLTISDRESAKHDPLIFRVKLRKRIDQHRRCVVAERRIEHASKS